MRARDEAEFTEFAAITIRRLRRTAYLMCGDWHRAEDAAQDALVKVYRRWNRIDRGDGLNGYAHRCVVTAVLDLMSVLTRRSFRSGRVVRAGGRARGRSGSSRHLVPMPRTSAVCSRLRSA
jgi:DNA-directed RNA polymerase specialized sigma24 family protein